MRTEPSPMPRLIRIQNLLLVFIGFLLLLNILLPTRYTVQLVRVEHVSEEQLEEEEATTGEKPSSVQHEYQYHPQQLVSKPPVEPPEETRIEKNFTPVVAAASRDAAKEKTRKKAKAFPRSRKEAELPPGEGLPWEEEMEARRDYKQAINRREDMERSRVNFHDPAQRMAYYKKLRRRLTEGGPDLKVMKERRMNRRLEMVRDMWDGWFEDDHEESLQLGGLSEYVTADISPESIQSELGQCTIALGMSSERLDSLRGDLGKTSKKVSAFLAAVKSLVPESFSPDFTSPCWYSDKINSRSNFVGITARIVGMEGNLQILPNQANYLARQAFGHSLPLRLFCLPHFFLAGFPKSATTTLSSVLLGHPQVSSAVVKESHWWTRAPILSPNENLLRLNVLRYLMHFRQVAHFTEERPELLSMDGSQSTLWDSNFVFNGHDFCSTPAAIAHVIPRAKFILLMREPSERLYSYYLWSCSFRYGNNTREWPPSVRKDPAGNFHTEVSQFIIQFNHCLEKYSLYECANKYTFKNSTKATQFCGQIGFRLVVSIYYIHIAKFLQFFPREQFLFLKMEDMTKEPLAFLHRVTDFLRIKPYPAREVRDALERKHNRQKADIGPMHRDTRQLLQEFFTPYNRQLARLLNDNRFLWGYS